MGFLPETIRDGLILQMMSQKGRSLGSGGRLRKGGPPQQRTCRAAPGRKGRARSCRALVP